MAEHIGNAKIIISTKERSELQLLRDAVKANDSLINFYREAMEEVGRNLDAALAMIKALQTENGALKGQAPPFIEHVVSAQAYNEGLDRGKREVLRTFSDRAHIQELTRRGIEA